MTRLFSQLESFRRRGRPASSAALARLARRSMTGARLATVPPDPAARDRAGPLLDLLAANDRYRASVKSAG